MSYDGPGLWASTTVYTFEFWCGPLPESPVQRCADVVHTMFNTTSGGGVEHVQHHF